LFSGMGPKLWQPTGSLDKTLCYESIKEFLFHVFTCEASFYLFENVRDAFLSFFHCISDASAALLGGGWSPILGRSILLSGAKSCHVPFFSAFEAASGFMELLLFFFG